MGARAARVVLGTLLALGAGCGRGGSPASPEAVDLTTPTSAYAGAMKAVEAGDLSRLAPYLTAQAALRLRRDLDAWREMLVHPREGPRLLSLPPPPRDAAEAEEVRRAIAGDPARLFRLYVAAHPHPYAPAGAEPPPGATRLELLYPSRDGSRRAVVLALADGLWKIDRLQL